MKKNVFKYLPIIILVGVVMAFFWKVFVGYIPFPGDLLVGAYYPWLENKFGYAVGVPIKNPLISDIFSQIYIWKKFIADSFIQGEFPLWNPYSHSGQPLLANYQSGALNPLNLLLGIFGSINGWIVLVISQTLGSILTMYLFLRSVKKEILASIIGATVYAFGGFATIWLLFVNAGFTMVWTPLVLMVIEKTARKNNNRYLLWLSPLLFLMVTSGHLQMLIYAATLAVCYFIYRIGVKNDGANRYFAISLFLSFCFGAVQLFPTIELMNRSIRFVDGAIKSFNYGLLPLQNVITLIAPDFFGNPSTGNFWGFFNYHGTVTYAGVIGFLGLTFGLLFFKKLKSGRFFVIAGVVALLLAFDTPLGAAIYKFRVPLLQTSDAGRTIFVFLLSMSVVVAEMIEIIGKLKLKHKLILFLPLILIILVAIGFLDLQNNSSHLNIAMRNLVIPLGLSMAFFVIFMLSEKIKGWQVVVLFIVLADLFRFGWKYIPFIPKQYLFPEMSVFEYIKNDKTIFRVDREKAEIMPPNTWMAYGLSSASGYDPMAVESYVRAYNRQLNMEATPGAGRYNEVRVYDAEALGKFNVKYLLAIKRDKLGIVPGDNIDYRIEEDEWKRVFQTPVVAVLLNTKYKDRARVIKSGGADAEGSATIISYGNNKVVVRFTNTDGEKLLLADTYYPGWVATIDGKETKIGDEIAPFRTVDIRGLREGEVVFEYKPASFRIGLLISGLSFALWMSWVCVTPMLKLRK